MLSSLRAQPEPRVKSRCLRTCVGLACSVSLVFTIYHDALCVRCRDGYPRGLVARKQFTGGTVMHMRHGTGSALKRPPDHVTSIT
jgi:hypothetical protein